MSHFAKIQNGIVVDVLVAEQGVIASGMFGDPLTFVKTSFNTRGNKHFDPVTGIDDTAIYPALRGNYASIGYIYDVVNDVFYPPQPYPSWTMDSATWSWLSPMPYPSDGKMYAWDEPSKSWVAF